VAINARAQCVRDRKTGVLFMMRRWILAVFQAFSSGSIRGTRFSVPRPPRIFDAGLLRHIVSRGTGRMRIFLDDGDRQMFMFLLAEVVTEYDLECYDYCLMDNHFHLAIRNRRRNLSAAMQKLKGEYAANWNVKHRRAGHTFEGPFKDQIVQDERYFLSLTRYIARNPVRAGIVGAPEAWRWSSYRCHAGVEPPSEFLATDRLLERFASLNHADSRAAYITHVTSVSDRDTDAHLFRSRLRILGDAEFRAAIKGQKTAAPASDVTPATNAVLVTAFR
jgi:REP element-mobilizing transposase RayT